ncbi:MAG: energy-coupling factor transporter transmembrane protein EcfT [Clostridia bacterium]|nr:energy-coupling factor transporter transmembrane protein EcfT [Clostridia bacterium]
MNLWEIRIKLLLVLAMVVGINLSGDSFALVPVVTGIYVFVTFFVFKKKLNPKSIAIVMFIAAALGGVQVVTVGSRVLHSINIFSATISFYEEGLRRGVFTFLRISGSTGVIFLAISSMSLNSFFMALRQLGLPLAFIEVMTIALKFTFIFKDEVFTIRKAQKARLGYSSLLQSAKSTGDIGGIVLLRAFDKSKVLAKSMKSRGYNGANIVHREG